MHRSFTDKAVGAQALEALVLAATRAPMAGNVLQRRIVVVTDAAVLRTLRAVTPGLQAIAPAVLAICTDIAVAAEQLGCHGRDISSLIDVGAAAENVALAAVALGLGTSFARSCTDAAVRVVLGLPEHVRPDLLVAVGHPAPTPSRAMRRPPPVVYHDRFGVAWEPPA